MKQWIVCLFRGHRWTSWFDTERRRKRTVCDRCCMEKTSLFDTDLNPSLF